MALELHHISKHFGDVTAVNNVGLTLETGEFSAFLGASGCGKTTLLRMIAGLETPSDGQIIVNGVDITNLPARERNMGLVFQNYALFPHMNVEKNIRFGLRMRKVAAQNAETRFRDIIDVTGLSDLLNRFPHQLSGGQKQRVAIARTLVTNPDVLMLDEPFANLDTQLRGDMRAFVRRLHDELKMTVIFVTHDQSEAMELAHRIAVFDRGELLQWDSPKGLYNHPHTLITAKYLGIENLIPAHWNGQNYETALGVLAASPPSRGTKGTLAIRADRILLNEHGNENTVPCSITARRFTGADNILTIQTGESQLTVRMPSFADISTETTRCTLPKDALHFIPQT